MQHIELYLEKFKSIGGDDFLLKKKMCSIINDVAHINLKEDEISLGNGTAHLSISGIRKTEFELRRETIMERLESDLSVR